MQVKPQLFGFMSWSQGHRNSDALIASSKKVFVVFEIARTFSGWPKKTFSPLKNNLTSASLKVIFAQLFPLLKVIDRNIVMLFNDAQNNLTMLLP